MAPETLISIQLLEWVETNVITKIIKFPFQQLLFGLKSKLKRLKCLENCVGRVSSLPEIITFDSTIGFLLLLFLSYNRSPRRLSNMRLKLKSRKDKIADVSNQPGTARAGLQPLRVHRKLNNHFFIINTPWAPKKILKKNFWVIWSIFWANSLSLKIRTKTFDFSPFPNNQKVVKWTSICYNQIGL